MPTADSPQDEKTEPSPAETWLQVSDALVAGLHHALNNRLAALAAVAQVLEAEVPADHPLRALLRAEVDRLQGTVGLLALLPHGRGRGPEPVQLGELLSEVVGLYYLHHDVRDVRCTVEAEGDVLPVYAEPGRLSHALLILLAAAGLRLRPGSGSEVRVRYGGDADWVTVRVEAHGERREPEAGEGEPVDPRAAGALLEAEGGELALAPAGEEVRYEARLPTLLLARRRQGRG